METSRYSPIISHIRFQGIDDDCQWVIQTNDDHCRGVAMRAEKFASSFGMGDWGRMMGLLHDRGKESDEFQCKIRYNSGYDTSRKPESAAPHSLTGAIVLHRKFPDNMCLMSNAVAGHHRGLYDMDELRPLLREGRVADEVSCMVSDVGLRPPAMKLKKDEIHHLVRMLYSCLVDADYLDTEQFMDDKSSRMREDYSSVRELKERLERYVGKFSSAIPTELNLLRNEVQRICAEKSAMASGVFELTVPTGGGKTIASVIWAVNHAYRHGKERIIIAIPFTSIIIQTAQVLRDIFGQENVVEHHSVVADEMVNDRNKLATENWDAPIIVTTNVQLFESMFSNRPSKCRKLHSLANSVVVLDEAQSLPRSFMQPVADAISAYARIFGTSFLLCTATQPLISGCHKGCGSAEYRGLDADEIRRIADRSMALHDRLRRVDMRFDMEELTSEDIARKIECDQRVLCIVNTRGIASEIYGCLTESDDNFHLSRMMCPLHIRRCLAEIKDRLDAESGSVRVVATQLVEAGVDIDFPVVYRQMAGLDSLLQAAGRCNREGRLSDAVTHVFRKRGYIPRGSIKESIYAMEELIRLKPESDWFDPDTIKEYYGLLYKRTPIFDSQDICKMSEKPEEVRYDEIARRFRLIDDDGMTLIVNYADADALISRLKHDGPSRSLMRELGQFSVSVTRRQFAEMCSAGMVEEPWSGVYYVADPILYDCKVGLKTGNDYLEQTFVI